MCIPYDYIAHIYINTGLKNMDYVINILKIEFQWMGMFLSACFLYNIPKNKVSKIIRDTIDKCKSEDDKINYFKYRLLSEILS